ncbi:unnamed protein product [Cylicocyclus nassatus]|uniref:Endonuclease/exonuclease/phosphatase domain-containing protein n=1 Tax=Cylicocyclus nassatus TaxID=53992 RepID=A0AA36GJQ2_CYLNA|nr:unnamed protein product [Cylicocyclus nassatus]
MATETPIYPLNPTERQKKRRIQFDATPPDFNQAAEELLKDENLPLYARTIVAFLMENRKLYEMVAEQNLYRTPSCPVSGTEQLVKALTDLLACQNSAVLMGDFNLPKVNWEDHFTSEPASISIRNFIQMCRLYKLSQQVKPNTCKEHLLDLIFTNRDNLVSDISVESPLGSSDHSSFRFQISHYEIRETEYVRYRDFRNADLNGMRQHLASVDWYGSFMTVTTVNEM